MGKPRKNWQQLYEEYSQKTGADSKKKGKRLVRILRSAGVAFNNIRKLIFSLFRGRKLLINLLILIALATGGFFIYSALFQVSDKEQIENNLLDFARLSSRTSADTTSSNLLKSRQLENYIAPECTVSVRVGMVSGTYTPGNVNTMAMRCKTLFKTAKLTFSDILVNVSSPTTAEAEFNVTFQGVYKQGSEAEGVRELRCTAKKIDGKWRFDSFAIRQILEK